MKILTVFADLGDYGACIFEDNQKPGQAKEIWLEARLLGEGQNLVKNLNLDGDGGTDYVFRAYEFGEVDPKFIKFMRDMQDYDSSKHENWLIIE